MKIAIHHRKGSFSDFWIKYCIKSGIEFKVVNCYSNDIVKDLNDCKALMWHFHHTNPKDHLFAKQLIFSLESCGKMVFPDFKSSWHFDDKVGQKYLLEAIEAPLVSSYVFYDEVEAYRWIEETSFPKVFKLRRGSGSNHVRLVRNKKHAKKLVRKAFSAGYNQYEGISNLNERWRKYTSGKIGYKDLLKGVVRLLYTTEFNRVAGKEKGYIYFQDFIPDNKFDIRINVVDKKCFAQMRKTRPGDFRASGSGLLDYDMKKIPKEAIKIAFDIAEKLNLQSVAFDFIMNKNHPVIVEMSYGFGIDPEDFDFGYWKADMVYIEGSFDPFGWMVEAIIKRIRNNENQKF